VSGRLFYCCHFDLLRIGEMITPESNLSLPKHRFYGACRVGEAPRAFTSAQMAGSTTAARTPAAHSAPCRFHWLGQPHQHPRDLPSLPFAGAGRRRPRAPLCSRRHNGRFLPAHSFGRLRADGLAPRRTRRQAHFFGTKKTPLAAGPSLGGNVQTRTNNLCVAQVDGRIVTGPTHESTHIPDPAMARRVGRQT